MVAGSCIEDATIPESPLHLWGQAGLPHYNRPWLAYRCLHFVDAAAIVKRHRIFRIEPDRVEVRYGVISVAVGIVNRD